LRFAIIILYCIKAEGQRRLRIKIRKSHDVIKFRRTS